MIRDLYRVLSEADAKTKAKSEDKPKSKPVPREEPLLDVKLVDGKKTRDTIAVDFIGGGHYYAYPDLIPKGEVWIEQDLAPDEQTDILVHELVEYALMKQGMTYTPAHNLANKLEKVFRNFEGRWKTKQAPSGDKKVEESLLVESYNVALPSFIEYLNGGIDPHDFSSMLADFFEDGDIDTPESFDEDNPYEILNKPEFGEIKAQFIKWLEKRIMKGGIHIDADMPTYLFMTGAKLVPRQTWLIHFSNDAGDIARNGFEFGAEDFMAIGLTTHQTEKRRKSGPGWNFAFKADDRRGVKGGISKYGKQAVMFQSAGVEAYHDGDNEQQVIFWGPNVKERILLHNDGGDWVVKHPETDKELVRSENIFDVIGWVKAYHDQYRKVITNAQVTKPIQPTPKADREKLQAKKPERTPQPFESEDGKKEFNLCPTCGGDWTIKNRGRDQTVGGCGKNHYWNRYTGKAIVHTIKEDENVPGTCPKCGLHKHRALPHLCPKGRSRWGTKGGKFTTPERPLFKTKKIDEGEEDLLTVVKQFVSNKHPDDHIPEDYAWARNKAFDPQGVVHMMPGGIAGWKAWITDEVKGTPGQWDKLAKSEKIDDPVIVSPGHIWDGWHRIAAAIVNGHKTIPAIVGRLNAQ